MQGCETSALNSEAEGLSVARPVLFERQQDGNEMSIPITGPRQDHRRLLIFKFQLSAGLVTPMVLLRGL